MICKELYNSFIRVRGYVLALVGVVLTLLLFFVTPTTNIPVKWLVVFAIPLLLLLIVICDVAHRAMQDIVLPKVKASQPPPPLYPDAVAILLLEKSNLFGQDSGVSVYFKEDDFEVLVGWGYVLTVQQGGLIQVLIMQKVGQAQGSVWDQIKNNDGAVLKKLLVRPSIPKIMLNVGV